ncbi:MAG TPA: class I SAM-dependent methyltransferase [Gemmatimonadaceae bacterium]|nr:class I SAM-dependent methyltransferase [Gemmatimonadaceae bacterium]
MDSAALKSSYEVVPYESRPITVTHPDRIAAIVALYGLAAPPLESCRVLELGCASGGNLIPMASGLPGGTFVGVDFAEGQVAAGRAMIERLGLTNVRLETMSIADIDDALGEFDYIICHGVYSWVPPEVQAATLRVCSRNLAPHGVAYVSYNTYPGWHLRGLAQDMVRFHDDPALTADARAERGRAFVQFVADSAPPHHRRYADLLRDELVTLKSETTSHFLHEQLELTNQPVYFEEFARRAGDVGLQYIAEAQPSALASAISDEARAAIRAWSGDLVRFEQYLDFLRLRTFRQTLLCHQGLALRPDPMPDALLGLHVAGRADPVGGDTVAGTRSFRSAEGVTVTTNNPIAIAALDTLHAIRPKTLPFRGLWSAVRGALASSPARYEELSLDDPLTLAAPLLQCVLGRLVEVHARERRVVAEAGDRPAATTLARLQAPTAQLVTNLRHVPVELDPLDRFVLERLDGLRDRATLLADLRQATARDLVRGDPRLVTDDLEQVLDYSLKRLAQAALIEA